MSAYAERLASLRQAFRRWLRCEKILQWEDYHGVRTRGAQPRAARWIKSCQRLYAALSVENHALPPKWTDGAPFHWDAETWNEYTNNAENRLMTAIRLSHDQDA